MIICESRRFIRCHYIGCLSFVFLSYVFGCFLYLHGDVEDIQPVPGIPEGGELSKAHASGQKLHEELKGEDT